MNFEELSFFYNKKSPIFLAEIVTLISCIILKTYAIDNRAFSQFVTFVMAVSIAEILLKTVGLFIWNRFISQKQTCETGTIILFFLLHLALLIYGIILYNNSELKAYLGGHEPFLFFLKCYVYCYGCMIFATMGISILVILIGLIVAIIMKKTRKPD